MLIFTFPTGLMPNNILLKLLSKAFYYEFETIKTNNILLYLLITYWIVITLSIIQN